MRLSRTQELNSQARNQFVAVDVEEVDDKVSRTIIFQCSNNITNKDYLLIWGRLPDLFMLFLGAFRFDLLWIVTFFTFPRNDAIEFLCSRDAIDRLEKLCLALSGFEGGSWYAEYPKCMFVARSWILSRDDVIEFVFLRSPGRGVSVLKSSFDPRGRGEGGRGIEVARGTNVGVHGIPSSSSPTKQAVTYIISPTESA